MSIFLKFKGLMIFVIVIKYHRLLTGTQTSRSLPAGARGYDNGVRGTGKQEGEPLSFKAVEMMKPGDKDKAGVGENRGLRVSCGATGAKSFFYRYTSSLTGNLAQVKIGNFPQTSLAAARLKLQELKLLRQRGRCPASELKQD